MSERVVTVMQNQGLLLPPWKISVYKTMLEKIKTFLSDHDFPQHDGADDDSLRFRVVSLYPNEPHEKIGWILKDAEELGGKARHNIDDAGICVDNDNKIVSEYMSDSSLRYVLFVYRNNRLQPIPKEVGTKWSNGYGVTASPGYTLREALLGALVLA